MEKLTGHQSAAGEKRSVVLMALAYQIQSPSDMCIEPSKLTLDGQAVLGKEQQRAAPLLSEIPTAEA